MLISRLTYLQLFEGKKYKTLSDRNRLSEWKIVSERGLVLDRENKILGGYYVLSAFTLVHQEAANALPWLYSSVAHV